MKPKDIFKLAVQVLGLVFLYHVLQTLPEAVVQFYIAFQHLNVGGMFTNLAIVAWPLAVAYWFLRGAPPIMRIAYPDAATGTKTETQVGGTLGRENGA